MLPDRRTTAHLTLASLLTVASACSEPTAPSAVPVAVNAATAAAAGSNNAKVKVKMFQLSANTLRIDGPGVTADVNIGNSGLAIQAGVSIRAEITQGPTTREAANLPAQCSSAPGDAGKLPTGGCDMTFNAIASNFKPGNGTLVPGAATFIVHVIETTAAGETELANKSLLVNLVATPRITTLTLLSPTLAIDGPGTTYTVGLQNPANSLQGVLLQGWIAQGPTTKRAAGGTLVSCGSNAGVFPPGTCNMTFSASAANAAAGTGTLVPGPASFKLELIQSIGGVNTTLDVAAVPITLVSSTPQITSLTLQSTSIEIDGPSVDYTALLQNPGFPLPDFVLLQGELMQNQGSGTIVVGAGGTLISCGAGLGVLPTTGTGTCSMQFVVTASTTAGGGGTLVPGPAQFVLHLYRAPPGESLVEFDTRTVDVTLTSPAPSIVSITPTSSFVVLDKPGAFTDYSTTIQNPGVARSTVIIQGWVRQGTARRAAGGQTVSCGTPFGTLPNGTCVESSVIVANNSPSAGTGTLVPGSATFELELKQVVGTVETILDTKTIPITLVANTPSIVSISLASTSLVINAPGVDYTATIYNPTGASLVGVLVQGWMDQGTTTRAAGGTLVNCTPTIGEMPAGSCVVSFTASASNGSSGVGVLVAGAATFRLQLIQGAVVLDTKNVAVTLTSP